MRIVILGNMLLLLFLLAFPLIFWHYFVARGPEGRPPGPWFRLPKWGQTHYFMGDRMAMIKEFRKR